MATTSNVIEILEKEGDEYSEELKYYYFNNLRKIYRNRGDCKLELEDYRGAISDYKIAIVLPGANPYPTPAELNNNIGRALLYLEDYQMALKHSNLAFDLQDRNLYTVNRGKVVTDDSALADTLFLRGFAYHYLGKKEEACKDWSKSGELGGQNAYKQIKENCK